MDHLIFHGRIDQPSDYSSFGDIGFRITELKDDADTLHIKGVAGFNDAKEDTTDFYFKYFKSKHVIEVGRHFRIACCDPDEYEACKHMWEYDIPQSHGVHFPYFRLPRSKDFVLIPHLVKSFWKEDVVPKIMIPVAANQIY